ncbi:uncharacterized protein LOC144883387 [Branchiostoma floridae x Branchiostoma japonicum]
MANSRDARLESYNYDMETWRLWCLHRVLRARIEARHQPDAEGIVPKIVDVRSISVEEFNQMGQNDSKRLRRSRKTSASRPRGAKTSQKCTEKATSPPNGAQQPKKCTKCATSPPNGAQQPKKCTECATSPPNGAQQPKKCTECATSPPNGAQQLKKCTEFATSPPRDAQQPRKCTKSAPSPPEGAEQPKKFTKFATSPPRDAQQPKKFTKFATSPPRDAQQPKKCTKSATSSPKGAEQLENTKNTMSPTRKFANAMMSQLSRVRSHSSAKNADVSSTHSPAESSASCVQNTAPKISRKRTHGSTAPTEAGLPKHRKNESGLLSVGKTSESQTVMPSVPMYISRPTVLTYAARQTPSVAQPLPGVVTNCQGPPLFWQPWQDHAYFKAQERENNNNID